MKSTVSPKTHEVGYVTHAQDYLFYLEGLPGTTIHTTIERADGARALVMSIDRDSVEAWMLDVVRAKPGQEFVMSSLPLSLPNPDLLLGRAITPLGTPIDGKGAFPRQHTIPIILDSEAPRINQRKIISEQFTTGITMIDTLLPLGKGQRELFFGDPRSGKSVVIRDIIANRKEEKSVCIYAAIAKEEVEIKRLYETIIEQGNQKQAIIIASASTAPAPLIAITPHAAFSLSESFRDRGYDVLLILDDLGRHAKYLREIALLSGRIPGRESYPADIFYQHSHLIERAGNFNESKGGGSITLLPVVETDLENFTGFLPTNVMSMTDGHIFFNSLLRGRGYYPSIVPERSVTRVGHQTQPLLLRELSDRVRTLLAHYQDLERYSRFGSELTDTTIKILKKGAVALELIRQEPGERISIHVQMMLLALLFSPFFDKQTIDWVKTNKAKIIETLQTHAEFQKVADTIPKQQFDPFLQMVAEKIPILQSICQQ